MSRSKESLLNLHDYHRSIGQAPDHIVVNYNDFHLFFSNEDEWSIEWHAFDCSTLEDTSDWEETNTGAIRLAKFYQESIRKERGIFCPIYRYTINETPCDDYTPAWKKHTLGQHMI